MARHRAGGDAGFTGEARPDENGTPLIECACGCGEFRSKYDRDGNERSFISGHHRNQIKGKNHYRWNSGRIIRSNGYVVIRVGKDHHLADSNGYAYEHRVIAEAFLGRRLRPNECVHHINGDKTDNSPENLKVYSRGDHNILHLPDRDSQSGRFLEGAHE